MFFVRTEGQKVFELFRRKKSTAQSVDFLIISWLGLSYLFQTLEDLVSVKDIQSDIQAIRRVLDEEQPVQNAMRRPYAKSG
jgi:hypothetical protein